MKFNTNALALAGALYFTAASSYVYERLDRSKAVSETMRVRHAIRALLTYPAQALIVIDMQVGLFGAARDFEPGELHRAMLGHAEIAQHFSLPAIITTSAETSKLDLDSESHRTILSHGMDNHIDCSRTRPHRTYPGRDRQNAP